MFFLDRAAEVVTAEHDAAWYSLIRRQLDDRGIAHEAYVLRPPTSVDSDAPLTEYYRSWRERDVSFRDYVEYIDTFPDDHFDLASVDGRSRVACVRRAYGKVKAGGLILLDNSARPDYFEAHLFLRDRGCVPHHFFGLIGYETLPTQTTIWEVRK